MCEVDSSRRTALRKVGAALGLGVCLLASMPASGWHTRGHSIVAEAAVLSLPADVPAFFRSGAAVAGHTAVDPDAFKDRATPNLRNQEGPEHYIDYELLKGQPLPPTRYEFLKLCARESLDPANVGLAPYAIAEWTERLTIAFAEHRKWPKNPHVQSKALIYAGLLAHYTGDLTQPLHTTVHHDGRAGADGQSPRSGIHTKVDSLIERLDLKPRDLAREAKPEALPALFPGVVAELERSRALIDRTYELETHLPPRSGEWKPSPEIRAYTEERARAAVRFTGSLYLTAWRNSARVSFPDWHERGPEGLSRDAKPKAPAPRRTARR